MGYILQLHVKKLHTCYLTEKLLTQKLDISSLYTSSPTNSIYIPKSVYKPLLVSRSIKHCWLWAIGHSLCPAQQICSATGPFKGNLS